MVPKEEVIELEMSVDDGLKMLISMGLVVPGQNGARRVKPEVQSLKPEV